MIAFSRNRLVWVLALSLASLVNCARQQVDSGDEDWSADLVDLVPSIDRCLAAIPQNPPKGLVTVSIARPVAEETVLARLGGMTVAPPGIFGNTTGQTQITHYRWECRVASSSSGVKLSELPKDAARLPGEGNPSFTRAGPLVLCVEGPCMEQRVYGPNGILLGYLRYPADGSIAPAAN